MLNEKTASIQFCVGTSQKQRQMHQQYKSTLHSGEQRHIQTRQDQVRSGFFMSQINMFAITLGVITMGASKAVLD